MEAVRISRDSRRISGTQWGASSSNRALCTVSGGGSWSVNGLRTHSRCRRYKVPAPTARGTRTSTYVCTYVACVPFERACRQRGLRACTSTLGVCTTIRAKCPAPSKPATNSAKRPETLDAIIWRLCRNNYGAATPRNQATANLFAARSPIVLLSQIIFGDAG